MTDNSTVTDDTLTAELDKILQTHLAAEDLQTIAEGTPITIPLFQMTKLRHYIYSIGQKGELAKRKLKHSLEKLEPKWGLSLELKWYSIQNNYIYRLYVSRLPNNDDGGGTYAPFIDPTPTILLNANSASPSPPKVMTMAAGAGTSKR